MTRRYAPKPRFNTPGGCYTASLEALLVGHEDWVHSVQWQPPSQQSKPSQQAQHAQHAQNRIQTEAQPSQQDISVNAKQQQPAQQDGQQDSLNHSQQAQHDDDSQQPLCLLSTSMDRTMMLWRQDPATGAAPI